LTGESFLSFYLLQLFYLSFLYFFLSSFFPQILGLSCCFFDLVTPPLLNYHNSLQGSFISRMCFLLFSPHFSKKPSPLTCHDSHPASPYPKQGCLLYHLSQGHSPHPLFHQENLNPQGDLSQQSSPCFFHENHLFVGHYNCLLIKTIKCYINCQPREVCLFQGQSHIVYAQSQKKSKFVVKVTLITPFFEQNEVLP
jgi:hypothetical protein